jgi:hypothetical protein
MHVCICVFLCEVLCMCVCACMQVQCKAIIIYAAAWVPAFQGPQKRPVIFQILHQTYFVCKFLRCCICTVILGLHISRTPRFIFGWNLCMSYTGPAHAYLSHISNDVGMASAPYCRCP